MRTASVPAVALVCSLIAALTIRPTSASELSRQRVVVLAPPGPGSRAAPEGTATALAARLECLGLVIERGLADGLPPLAPSPGIAGASAPRANPFTIDPARVWLVTAPDSAAAAAADSALASDPAIAWVEPNLERAPMIARADAALPDDPLLRDGRQWGLRNLGPAGLYGGMAGADIRALDAWARSCGSNDLLLAVADTGIDPTHPDLAGTLPDGRPRIAFPTNVTTEPGGAVMDSFGHGTLVAGVMAARTGDGPHFDSLGIAGVCGGDGRANAGCRIVPIKIARGRTGSATSFDIARAILYATALGARVVNLSFAGAGESAIERAALYDAVTRGCIVVAASGNRGSAAPQYPAAYAADGLCIAVGASDESDRRCAFSSFGPGLDLVAPGTDIWTTFMTYPSAAGAHYPGYVAAAGTSFAAPFVSGTVGLLAAARPELTDTDFQRLIRESAHDVGAAGPDAETGWGRLDAAAALAAADPTLGVWHDEVACTELRFLGSDTLRLGDPGPGTMSVLRGAFPAERWECAVTVAIPDSFRGPVRVWPRVGGTFTVRPGFRLPYFAPWCEVAAIGAASFTLRGDLYRVPESELPAGIEDPWVPVPPDQARFGFTVMGRVERTPTLGVPASARMAPKALSARPIPAYGFVRLAGPASARVTITDLAGRVVARVALDAAAGGGRWDGRRADGSSAPPGLYLARADAAARAGTCRIVWLGPARP